MKKKFYFCMVMIIAICMCACGKKNVVSDMESSHDETHLYEIQTDISTAEETTLEETTLEEVVEETESTEEETTLENVVAEESVDAAEESKEDTMAETEVQTEPEVTEEVKPKKSNYKKRVKKVQLAVVVSEPQEDICVCDCEPVADSPEKTNWFVKVWNKFILRRK